MRFADFELVLTDVLCGALVTGIRPTIGSTQYGRMPSAQVEPELSVFLFEDEESTDNSASGAYPELPSQLEHRSKTRSIPCLSPGLRFVLNQLTFVGADRTNGIAVSANWLGVCTTRDPSVPKNSDRPCVGTSWSHSR